MFMDTESGKNSLLGKPCKKCGGDGWVFHSNGQSGINKDCPKCDGTGFIKKCDMCGKDFSGNSFVVVDENYNELRLMQCRQCFEKSISI